MRLTYLQVDLGVQTHTFEHDGEGSELALPFMYRNVGLGRRVPHLNHQVQEFGN
jgi:hypothetical protein